MTDKAGYPQAAFGGDTIHTVTLTPQEQAAYASGWSRAIEAADRVAYAGAGIGYRHTISAAIRALSMPAPARACRVTDDTLIAAMLAIEEMEHQFGWFEKWRHSMDEWKGEHYGDCTKQNISCLRCAYDDALTRLPEFKRILAALIPDTEGR